MAGGHRSTLALRQEFCSPCYCCLFQSLHLDNSTWKSPRLNERRLRDLHGIPAMWLAMYGNGKTMLAAIVLAEFLLLLNTGPLNAAVINSVGPHVRAIAIAVNIFVFHLLGDVPSSSLIGYMSDRYSLRAAFVAPVIAVAISSAILFYGMRFAPPVHFQSKAEPVGAH